MQIPEHRCGPFGLRCHWAGLKGIYGRAGESCDTTQVKRQAGPHPHERLLGPRKLGHFSERLLGNTVHSSKFKMSISLGISCKAVSSEPGGSEDARLHIMPGVVQGHKPALELG